MIEGFLLHLQAAVRTAWVDALPVALTDTWWRRGEADRVSDVLALDPSRASAPLLVEYAALDREPQRAVATLRRAFEHLPYGDAALVLIAPRTTREAIEIARTVAQRVFRKGSTLHRLIHPDLPIPPLEEVADSALLRAWRAVRASAPDELATAWEAPDEIAGLLFATRALDAWELVPAAYATGAARLLGFDDRCDVVERVWHSPEAYCAAAITVPALRDAWLEPIRAVAADREDRYTEGLITSDEHEMYAWASARCDGEAAIDALERDTLASVRETVEALVAQLGEPPRPVGTYSRDKLERLVAAACSDTGPLHRAGLIIERVGERGGYDLVRDAIDRIEAARGPLGDTLVEAQLYYPGRAAALAERLLVDHHPDDLTHAARVLSGLAFTVTAYRRGLFAAALARDGELHAARVQAARLFAESPGSFPMHALATVAPHVLATHPEGRDRCAKLARVVLDRLSSAEPAPSVSPARSPELEVALAEHDDAATALVYADYLGSNGDPRGELLALHAAGRLADAQLLLERHADHFLGPLACYARTFDGTQRPAFRWRHGFIAAARLGFYHDCAPVPAGRTLGDALAMLLAHPSGALLRELTVTINLAPHPCDFTPAVAAIAHHGAPALRALRIGEFSCSGARNSELELDYQMSWATLPDLAPLWRRVPRLERLVLQGSAGEVILGGIDLPLLRSLAVMTGGMARDNVAAIAAARWPTLERLELWFGDAQYGATSTVDDVLPLLDRERFPRLSALHLLNADFTDALVVPLARSSLLPQLRELGLALGTLSDAGAAQLAAHRDRFAHLAVLDVERSCLTDDGIALVASLAARCDAQKDERYVSVGE